MKSSQTAKLSLTWRQRAGRDGITPRAFLDFVVDETSLFDVFSAKGWDLISCLGWFTPEHDKRAVKALLLSEPSELKTDRHPLYVCPECGDIDCGAITVKIEKSKDCFIWQDFGFENDLESGPVRLDESHNLTWIGPFYFNKTEYWQVLNDYLQTINR